MGIPELLGKGKIKLAILGVSGVALLSKVFGLLREMVIAEKFGTSHAYDLLLIGIAAPAFFQMVFSNATNFLVVPFLSKRLGDNPNGIGWRSFWKAFDSLLGISLLLGITVMLAAPALVRLIAPSLSPGDFEQGVFYCRMISIIIVLGFIESLLRSALNVKKVFVYPAVGAIILNLSIIIIIYLFAEELSVASLILAFFLGHFLQVIFLSFKLAGFGIVQHFEWKLFDKEVLQILNVGGVVVLVELLIRSYFLIDRHFASALEPGVISALSYAGLLMMLPVNIVGSSIASVTFPYLSEKGSQEHISDFAHLLHKTIRFSLVMGIPCSIFYIMFARELTAAAFFRGAFDLNSLELTSQILILLAPNLLFLFFTSILLQACYSAGRQKAVLLIAIIAITSKAILAGLFSHFFGYRGIALSITAVEFLTMAMMIFLLFRDKRITGLKNLLNLAGKTLAISLPIIGLGLIFKSFPDFDMGAGIISKFRIIPAAVTSFIIFMGLGYWIKLDEVRTLTGYFKRGN